MIDQAKLNEAAEAALRTFVSLLPTMANGISSQPRDEGLELTVGNPHLPDRPIKVLTSGKEITVCFAGSHYHIADYNQGRTEAELVEDMILGTGAIVGGHLSAYSSFQGGRCLGGGLISAGDETRFTNDFWKRADRFQVFTWDTSGDRSVEKTLPLNTYRVS